LAFTALVLLQGIPKALVWTPYTSKGPHRKGAHLAHYTGSTLLHLLALAAVGSLALAGIGCVFLWIPNGSNIGWLFLLLSPLLVLFLVREQVRRVALAWLEIKDAVVMDTAVSIVQVGAVLWLAQMGRLSAGSALLAIALANCIAIAWIFLWKKRDRIAINVADAFADGSENWSFSKWLLPGAILTLFCEAAYRWFVPLTHGLDSLAIFVAAMSLIRILNPLIVGLSNWSNPLSSNTYAREGAEGLYRLTRRATALLLGVVSFCLPIFIFWGGTIVAFLFGDKYLGTGPVVTALALGMLVQALLLPVDSALLALQQGRFLLMVVSVRLVLTYTLGLALTWKWGPVGAGYGMFISSTAMLVMDWVYFTKLIREGRPVASSLVEPIIDPI
jgi:O-antigen/teichoic acid export membrane protein